MGYNGEFITIMATSECNIRCKHCYISYSGKRSIEDFNNLFDTLAKKKYAIEVNGAELLTDKRYFEVLKRSYQDFIMTNGLEIYKNPDILNYLKGNGVRRIFMSYHYGIQDELSPVTTQMLKENIKTILAAGMQVRLYTTITKHNYNKVHDICKEAIKLGASSIRFTNFIKQGNAKNLSDDNILSDDEILVFLKQVDEERKLHDKTKFRILRCGSFGKGNSEKFNCYAGYDHVVITPDNNIYPCIFLAKKGFEIGKYENGEIIITRPPKHNCKECLTKLICNRGKSFDEVY